MGLTASFTTPKTSTFLSMVAVQATTGAKVTRKVKNAKMKLLI